MYDYSSDSSVLSVIARGRGLLEGGVELDCINTETAFSLSGKPFLEESATGSGRSCKPLRTHKLTLPKTYVTRRGAMVLFTAPEDMVIGQACNITEREPKNRPKYEIPGEIINRMKTTSALKQGVLGYNVSKYKESCSDLNNVTQPGHFTNVYLESLQRATEQSKLKVQDCEVEDIEIAVDVPGDAVMADDDKLPTDGRDSGIGQSVASSSIPSVMIDHLSSGTPSRVHSGLPKSSYQDTPVTHEDEKDDILNLLKSQITDVAASRDKATKSKKPKPAMSTHLSSKKLDTGSRKKSPYAGTGKKKGKTHQKKSPTVSMTEEVNGLRNLEDTSTTSHSFISEQQKSSSAIKSSSKKSTEQKQASVEMKRLEKSHLEEERLFKEQEKSRLRVLLEEERQKRLEQLEKSITNSDVDVGSLSKIKCPYVTPGQVSGLAALERQRVLEEGLELSAMDEALNEKAVQRDQEADELLRRAKEAEATFAAELKEHERLQRLKKEEEEKQLIAMEAKKLEMENEARRKLEQEKKRRDLHNKTMNMDLLSCRMNQGISRPWTYSYFQYVPVQRKESNSKKRVTKTRTIKRK